MTKIAIHVEKGGVGKSSLTGSLSHLISKQKKILMIDADPQGNLSSWFCTDPIQYELADVLEGRCSIEEVKIPVREDFDIIPTFGIDGNLKNWGETTLFQKPFTIHDFLDQVKEYDYCCWDLSPGISNLEKSILSCMDEVIGISAAEYFSVDGIEMFKNELDKLRRDRRAHFKADKMVINRVNNGYSLHREYQEQFKKMNYQLYTIGQSTGISDCVPHHQTVFEYDPQNKNIPEFERLTNAILGDI